MLNNFKIFIPFFLIYLCFFAQAIYSAPKIPAAAQARLQNLPSSVRAQLLQQYQEKGVPSAQPIQQKEKILKTEIPTKEHKEILGLAQHFYQRTTEKIPAFGYEVFGRRFQNSEDSSSLPVPDDYLLQPGDEVRLHIYGKENDQYQLSIHSEGFIDIPKLGPFQVAGMSYLQARKNIQNHLQKQIIGVKVSVVLGNLKSIRVLVLGDVRHPAYYSTKALSTLTQALGLAGGVAPTGSLRKIDIRRQGKITASVDLYELLLAGQNSGDVHLKNGDTIFVHPKGGEVMVYGKVKRPGVYELSASADIKEVIRMAGGLRADAYTHSISIERFSDQGSKLHNVDLMAQNQKPFDIVSGDIIEVKAQSTIPTSMVQLQGEVLRGGNYEFFPGMHISDLIISQKEGLKPTTDLSYGLVVREINSQGHIKILQFAPSEFLKQANSTDNIKLQNLDRVIFFPNTKKGVASKKKEKTFDKVNSSELAEGTLSEKKARISRQSILEPIIERLRNQSSISSPAKVVQIGGFVKLEGVYPLSEGAHLSDLIIAAGGLKESAHLLQAELTRSMLKEGDSYTLTHQRLNLVSLFKRQNSLNPLKAELDLSSPQNSKKLSQNILLKAQDQINIFPKPGWSENYTVKISGEVLFPGAYSVKKGESLLNVIQRAGGLTPFAYTEGAIFSRVSLRKREQQHIEMLRKQLRMDITALSLQPQSVTSQAFNPADALALVDQLNETEAFGRLTIDLSNILRDKKNQEDLLLENGDLLHVPARPQVISIIGEVQYVSNHMFDSEKNLDDYLELAGGTKGRADLKRIYVIHSNGSVSLPNKKASFFKRGFKRGRPRENQKTSGDQYLREGDTIVVPTITDYTDKLGVWTKLSQILYQTGIAWKAIND